MPDGRNLIYLYDGSFEGLLTAVFECYAYHEFPYAIEETEYGQQSLFGEYLHITTDKEKSDRVSGKIIETSGRISLYQIYLCYLSTAPSKGINIFNYIRACLKFGKTVNERLNIDCVNYVVTTAKSVSSEAHLYREFIRFSELENGVYYSKIEPKNDILTVIAPHFSHRYSSMPFIIHDLSHRKCLIYNGKSCAIYDVDSMPDVKLSQTESEYRQLWKDFYNTVAIPERRNEKCRMTHMPKHFWKYMTEFQDYC